MERRRQEKAKEKSERGKLSSPKRIVSETVVVSERDSDREQFEPWEDVDEVPGSPLSEVTVSGELDTRYARCLANWKNPTLAHRAFPLSLMRKLV